MYGPVLDSNSLKIFAGESTSALGKEVVVSSSFSFFATWPEESQLYVIYFYEKVVLYYASLQALEGIRMICLKEAWIISCLLKVCGNKDIVQKPMTRESLCIAT